MTQQEGIWLHVRQKGLSFICFYRYGDVLELAIGGDRETNCRASTSRGWRAITRYQSLRKLDGRVDTRGNKDAAGIKMYRSNPARMLIRVRFPVTLR